MAIDGSIEAKLSLAAQENQKLVTTHQKQVTDLKKLHGKTNS